jgi:hypothetical protein
MSGRVTLFYVSLVAGLTLVPVWFFNLHRSELFWGALLSAGFGGATGASEIISRYRDEPLRAIGNKYGLSYVAVNAGLAATAFGLLHHYAKQLLPGAAIEADWLLRAIMSGFGAMVIVRSKLFIFHAEDGKDYPIGPAIVIETFLQMLDRKIDRHRASRRQQRVFTAMAKVIDFDRSADYLTASLLSFQNLSEDEKVKIAKITAAYKAVAWPAALKSAALGMAFLTIAGEENFDQIMVSLQAYLGTFQPTNQPPGQPPGPPATAPVPNAP